MPRFSVIVPLVEERGVTMAAIAGWACQAFPADGAEILAVAPPGRWRAATVPRLSDRFLRADCSGLAHLYDTAARVARGEFVLLTEAHCVPKPDCLAALDAYLRDHPDLAGACVNSIAHFTNSLGRLDSIMFEDGFREFTRDGDWRKINVHGVALRKTEYDGCGGLQTRYGRFAEMLLAAKLRDRGARLGFAADAAVTHHYSGDFGELLNLVNEFVRGETIYRAEHPGPDRVGYTFLPEVANPIQTPARGLGLDIARSITGDTHGRLRSNCPWLVRKLDEMRRRAVARTRVKNAIRQCRALQSDVARLERAYRGLMELAAECSRLRALASLPDVPSRSLGSTIAISDLRPEATVGFYPFEQCAGRPFRWTTSYSAVRLPFPAGCYTLRIDTGYTHRSSEEIALRTWIDGLPVKPACVSGGYEVPVRTNGHGLSLILECEPFRPAERGVPDERTLGIPIFSFSTIKTHPEIKRKRTIFERFSARQGHHVR